jgi:hypothetical protein
MAEGETHTMKNVYAHTLLCLACFSTFLTIVCWAQKTASKADNWALQNAGIDSVEIAAGTSRQIQVTYPVPDGPEFPLKASVTWSIEPAVKGISIDKAGTLKVDAGVPHGTTATILADLEKGRKKLSGKVYVFHPDQNPLIGQWHVDTHVTCGEPQEIKAAAASPLSLRGYNWSFQANQDFWVGRAHNIAARMMLTGAYEVDVKSAKIKLTPSWPKKPVSNWSYVMKNGGKTLILRPLEHQDDLEAGCDYILTR